MQSHLFFIYRDMRRADDVVDKLLAAGVGREHISILTSQTGIAKRLARSPVTKASEGGDVGASLGAIGLVAGTLITAVTAGVGVLATGPLFTGLASPNADGTSGGLADALIGVGIPDAEAKVYAREVADKDAVLIAVEATDSDRDQIRQIFTNDNRRPSLLARA